MINKCSCGNNTINSSIAICGFCNQENPIGFQWTRESAKENLYKRESENRAEGFLSSIILEFLIQEFPEFKRQHYIKLKEKEINFLNLNYPKSDGIKKCLQAIEHYKKYYRSTFSGKSSEEKNEVT